MGGGKGGGSSLAFAPPQTVEGQQYLQQYPDVAAAGMNPWYHYNMHGQAEGRRWGQPQELPSFEFPEMKMPSYDTPDYAAIQAEQQAEAAKARGLAEVNSLYRRKFDAANKAADEINNLISEEMAHANLYGLDYTTNEAIKRERINNRFAAYWSEADEKALAGLVKKWGDAGNQWTSGIVRGTADDISRESSSERPAGKSVRARGATNTTVRTPLTDEEELLGGITSALGG